MIAQLDMFAGDETRVRSFPPHLDPGRAFAWDIVTDVDKDHVAERVAGELPVGAVGNNAEVFLAQVRDKDGIVLASFPFATWRQARDKLDECIEHALRNGQGTFL